MPEGTQTITFGWRGNSERCFCAWRMKYLIIVAVVSKSAITPSFIGRIGADVARRAADHLFGLFAHGFDRFGIGPQEQPRKVL